jgi:hypothetical protein
MRSSPDASCDRPRGTRDHLLGGDNHHLARVVVPSLIRLAKRPLTALCSRWLTTRRMGENAP